MTTARTAATASALATLGLAAASWGVAVPTGGFQQAFWVLDGIALIALPAIFALARREELGDAVTKTTIGEAQPARAAAN